MTKFTIVITTLFLAMTGISATRTGGLRSGPPGPEGPGGPGGRPGPGGPGGPGGMGNGFRGPFGGMVDESALVDLSCPDTNAAANEPDCALRNGELGTWLCRTAMMVEPLTGESDSWSTCGNATRALPSDECGCCDGVCPVLECTCGCSLEGVADAGVLVAKTSRMASVGEEHEHETCLAPEKAISLIAKPGGRFRCLTECPSIEMDGVP
jgi:hypothetical protein